MVALVDIVLVALDIGRPLRLAAPLIVVKPPAQVSDLFGLHSDAYRALHEAGIADDQIVQGYGNDPRSAGTHAYEAEQYGSDFSPIDPYPGPDGRPYACAVDLDVSDSPSEDAVRETLHRLVHHGFCAWYRHTGSFAPGPHIHAFFVGARVKPALRRQFRDFISGRDGLKSHSFEPFFQPSRDEIDHLKALYRQVWSG